jgi:MYXO-CTERM domain-containing protein
VAAAAFLRANAARLRLETVSLLAGPRVLDIKEARVVRFAQEHEGVPVFGRGVIVRLDAAGRVRSVTDHSEPALDLVTVPGIREAEAHEAASQWWGLLGLAAPEIVLGVFPEGRHPVLAYRVDGNRGFERVRTYVDAITGRIIAATTLLRNARAWVYQQNPVATPTVTDVELMNLSEDATGLTGRIGQVVRYVSGSLNQQNPQPTDFVTSQTPTSDGTNFYFTPTADASQPEFDDPFAESQAYFHVESIFGFFHDTFGFDPDFPYLVLVNYSEGGAAYDNAAFTPLGTSTYGILLGQGNDIDFAYDGDVIYHEFTHSVIHDLTNMGYMDTMFDRLGWNIGPGAIHEGLADYFATSFTNDSTLGEYSLAPLGGVRNLNNTRTCPDNVLGEMHEDGEIMGGATWALRTALADAALADELTYLALAQLPSTSTFRQFAEAYLGEVDDKVTDGAMTPVQRDAVNGILEARGLVRCGRDIPLTAGEDLGINLIGFSTVGQMMGASCSQVRQTGLWIPAPFQFKVPTPANATSVTFRISYPQNATDLQYKLYVRQGEMVEFRLEMFLGMIQIPIADEFDRELSAQTGLETVMTVNLDSTPAFVPGADYYFVLVHQNCPMTIPTITAEVTTEQPQVDAGVPDAAVSADASTTPPDEPKDGCSCASTGAGEGLALLLLVLGALFFIRRRR